MFLRNFGFYTPPASSVFCYYNLSFYVNSQFIEYVVVGRKTVVDKYQFASNVTIGTPRIIGW